MLNPTIFYFYSPETKRCNARVLVAVPSGIFGHVEYIHKNAHDLPTDDSSYNTRLLCESAGVQYPVGIPIVEIKVANAVIDRMITI